EATCFSGVSGVTVMTLRVMSCSTVTTPPFETPAGRSVAARRNRTERTQSRSRDGSSAGALRLVEKLQCGVRVPQRSPDRQDREAEAREQQGDTHDDPEGRDPI